MYLIFVVLIGACVGSFLNVVVYRLPEGKSLVHPPSACPKCSHKLAWRDNIPVLGWFLLGGKCRYCHAPISMQYPIVEAATAVLFGGWFAVCYMSPLRPAFSAAGPIDETAMLFALTLLLIGSLIAATLIDARLYIIPLSIPWLVTGAAIVLMPAAVWLFPGSVRAVTIPPAISGGVLLTPSERLEGVEPAGYVAAGEVRAAAIVGRGGPVIVSAAPRVGMGGIGAAGGGAMGLILALLLLRAGVLRRSFDDEITAEQDEEHLIAHEENVPQLALPLAAIVGAGTAAMIASGAWTDPASPAPWPALLGGLAIGYAVAASIMLTLAMRCRGTGAASADAPNDGVVFQPHPHTRREMLKELAFIALPAGGMLIGSAITWAVATTPEPVHVLAGTIMGYLIGGGVVWMVRVLGSLLFGKEAMGLGDVHLMGAVGAVAGWEVATTAFFLAAFMGVAHVVLTLGLGRVVRFKGRQIPYGPQLAAATLIAMVWREPIVAYWGMLV